MGFFTNPPPEPLGLRLVNHDWPEIEKLREVFEAMAEHNIVDLDLGGIRIKREPDGWRKP